MKKIFLFVFWAISFSAPAQNLYFPPLVGQNWETISPASLGWCDDKIQPLFDFLEAQNSKAFIVLKDGRIVIEQYFGTFQRDSLWYWASAGKSLTATLVGIAQQEGLLDISETSQKYLGQNWTACSPSEEQKITIRHQLTMTSGLNDGVADPYCTDPACLQCLAEPGSRWAYHNAPYTLLDKVIEGASGQTLNQFFNSRVRNKTGINGAFFKVDFNNLFLSNARSMARFGLLALNRGNWNGTPVLSDATYFDQMTTSSQSINPAYGYLWWLNGSQKFMLPSTQIVFPGMLFPAAPADMFSALGKNGQTLNVVPSMGLVVVRMGNSVSTGLVDANLSNEIWKRLNEVICVPSTTIETQISNPVLPYPNPASDFFSLNFSGQQNFKFPATVRVSDFSGKVIFEKRLNAGEEKIEIAELPKGIFQTSVFDAAGRFSGSGKLVKF